MATTYHRVVTTKKLRKISEKIKKEGETNEKKHSKTSEEGGWETREEKLPKSENWLYFPVPIYRVCFFVVLHIYICGEV